MKRRIFIGLFLLLLGWLFVEGISSNRLPKPKVASTKSERVSARLQQEGSLEQHLIRFDGLETMFITTALHLEKTNQEWLSQRPPYENWKVKAMAWDYESRRIIGRLTIEEVEAFVVWIMEGENLSVTEVDSYLNALLWSWGQRAPIASLKFLSEIVGKNEKSMSAPHGLAGMNPRREFIEECLFSCFQGIADANAKLAWSELENFEAARAVRLGRYLRGAILSCHARQNQEEAWEFLVEFGDEKNFRRLLEGYIEGVPRMENWSDFVESLQGLEFANNKDGSGTKDWIREEVALRWFQDEPQVALKWYASNADYFRVFANRSGGLITFEGRRPELEEQELRLSAYLLRHFTWEEGQEGIEMLSRWLAEQLPEGNAEAGYFMESFLAQHIDSPEMVWLVPLVAKMPAEDAERVFTDTLEKIPVRTVHNELGSSGMTLSSPNVILDAIRSLGKELQPVLSDEALARAELAFERVEEEEALRKEEGEPFPRF